MTQEEGQLDKRQDRDKARRGGLSRRVWVYYLITGAALAVSRVALLVTAMPDLSSYAVIETFQHLWWVLEPEVFLVNSTSLGSRGSTWMEILLGMGALLTVGSFIMATPILLVGWLRHRGTTPPPSR